MRRPGKIAVIIVIVLAVLGMVADRGGQLAAERVVAGKMKSTLGTPDRPDVDLGGFPFLTELVRGKFRHVVIDLANADGGKVQIARVHADLHGVRQHGNGVSVDEINGNGLITYAAVSEAAKPVQVDFGGSGLIRMSAEVRVLGRDLTATASGRPRIEGQTLVISPEKVSTSETGDAALAARAMPDIRVPLRDVPPNLIITLDPQADGIHFTFTGSDVQLASKDQTAAGPQLPAARTRSVPVPLT